VQVVWSETERPIKQIAYTLDVSRRGARLAGVKGLSGPGRLITVKRHASEARFRVVWIGRPRTPQEGQIGIECVDCEKVIWDVDFAKMREDFQPTGTVNSIRLWKSASQKDAKTDDYSCPGTAHVWSEEVGSQRLEARLIGMGLDGCQLEGPARLPLNMPVLVHLQIGEIQLTVKGAWRERGIAGAWIEFTHTRCRPHIGAYAVHHVVVFLRALPIDTELTTLTSGTALLRTVRHNPRREQDLPPFSVLILLLPFGRNHGLHDIPKRAKAHLEPVFLQRVLDFISLVKRKHPISDGQENDPRGIQYLNSRSGDHFLPFGAF
jgi:hypothetical protein